MRVLHVSDVMGGGIESALLAMVDATPDLDHHLLWRARSGHDTGASLAGHFGSVHELPAQPWQALVALRRLTRELFPDVVHAHSSVAGVLTRAALLGGPRVVYSPHCFAFDRQDVGGLQRRMFHVVERALAPRTDLLLAVAPRELEQASALGHRRVAFMPNRAEAAALSARHDTPLRVVTAGRVCPQKDWRYFLHLKRYAEDVLGLEAQWTWLGGGTRADEQALSRAGVEVSGWITREQLVRRLAEAQVYVHTAAWEASPLTILEAAAVGLPLAVRAIPSLDGLQIPGRHERVVDLAERVAGLETAAEWQHAHEESLALSEANSARVQAKHLREAYARSTEPARPPASVTLTAPGATVATASSASMPASRVPRQAGPPAMERGPRAGTPR